MNTKPAKRSAPQAETEKQVASIEAATLPAAPRWFQNADHVIQNFHAVIPRNHGKETIMAPEYWAHHVGKVTPLGMIICIDELRRWEVWLRIVEKGANFLRVAVIHDVDYEVKVRGEESLNRLRKGYTIEEMGVNGYRVLDPNKKEMVAGLLSQKEAEQFVDLHLLNMNQAA